MIYKKNFIKQALLQFFVNTNLCEIDCDSFFESKGFSKQQDLSKKTGSEEEVSRQSSRRILVLKQFKKDHLTISFDGPKATLAIRTEGASFALFDGGLEAIRELFFDRNIVITRIGLRYTNVFPKEIGSAFFTQTVKNFIEDTSHINSAYRVFNSYEFIENDFRVIKRISFFNPKYPSPYTAKMVCLDYDVIADSCAIDGEDELNLNLNKQVNTINSLFESDISDEMRRYLNE